MRKLFFLLTAVLSILFSAASSETLVLPDALSEIGDEAFAGDQAITSVVVNLGAERIGAGAFRGCSQLQTIALPSSVQQIAEDAFTDCHKPLLIRTIAGSNAMQFAISHQLDYQADTTYRALLVGQTDYLFYEDLPGSANDLSIMQNILSQYGYSVSARQDLTADEIHSAISACFSQAQPQDVTLFFYAGHGMNMRDAQKNGALVGVDNSLVTGATLRTWLDAIPGRKIVILDSCYSGNVIGRSSVSPASQLASSLLEPFTYRSRSGELAASEYYVITAAHSTQQSWEFTTKKCGVFTYCLGLGCGYDYDSHTACTRTADTDHDGVITLHEAYQHTLSSVAQYLLPDPQVVQVYPSNCSWFGIFRQPE